MARKARRRLSGEVTPRDLVVYTDEGIRRCFDMYGEESKDAMFCVQGVTDYKRIAKKKFEGVLNNTSEVLAARRIAMRTCSMKMKTPAYRSACFNGVTMIAMRSIKGVKGMPS